MMIVFILWHVHPPDTEEQENLVGIYTTEVEARAAADRLKRTLAFMNCAEGFHIDQYRLNKDHWIEGYTTIS
jgi:hypothetical protein